eukprot:scaffold365599_cov43-Prasinocladus_malaysianus.AAC.1
MGHLRSRTSEQLRAVKYRTKLNKIHFYECEDGLPLVALQRCSNNLRWYTCPVLSTPGDVPVRLNWADRRGKAEDERNRSNLLMQQRSSGAESGR